MEAMNDEQRGQAGGNIVNSINAIMVNDGPQLIAFRDQLTEWVNAFERDNLVLDPKVTFAIGRILGHIDQTVQSMQDLHLMIAKFQKEHMHRGPESAGGAN